MLLRLYNIPKSIYKYSYLLKLNILIRADDAVSKSRDNPTKPLTPGMRNHLLSCWSTLSKRLPKPTRDCYCPYCPQEVEAKSLLLETPECFFPEDLLPWYEKVSCDHQKEGSNQQFYTAVAPVNDSIDPQSAVMEPVLAVTNSSLIRLRIHSIRRNSCLAPILAKNLHSTLY